MCRIVQYFRSWLVLSAFVCCQADGQIAISLSSGTGIPGATTALNINLNASTSQPAMLQWEMNYSPADISLITVSAGTSATLAGKTVICSSIGTGRIRCLVYGMNGTPVPSGTVAVATVALFGSTTSTSTSIALSNAVAVNPPGSGIATTASGNSLTILQASALVTVATNPPGLSINVDGTTFTAPRTFQWVPGSSHTVNAASPQGSGGTRYSFFSWSDGGAQSHTIAPTSAATYTANFTTQFLLTTSGTGGSIGASPSSPDGHYTGGTSVQLTATPSSGQQFSSWSGDAAGSANPVSVTMSAPRSVTANFTSAPQSITVTTNPPGLSDGASDLPMEQRLFPHDQRSIATAFRKHSLRVLPLERRRCTNANNHYAFFRSHLHRELYYASPPDHLRERGNYQRGSFVVGWILRGWYGSSTDCNAIVGATIFFLVR
jgi:hypothetical protein